VFGIEVPLFCHAAIGVFVPHAPDTATLWEVAAEGLGGNVPTATTTNNQGTAMTRLGIEPTAAAIASLIAGAIDCNNLAFDTCFGWEVSAQLFSRVRPSAAIIINRKLLEILDKDGCFPRAPCLRARALACLAFAVGPLETWRQRRMTTP
jgi:hypothetical protein